MSLPDTMPKTMKGAMLLGPEEIEVRDVPVPHPGPGEILLSIEAATTCGTDVKVFRRGGHPRMLKTPTLFGHEMAGRVATTGEGVTGFSEGDAVVVANSAPCGDCGPCHMGRENLCEDLHYINGAFAEFILVPERFVGRNTHHIPDGLSFAKAALTEPLACVLHGLDACELDRYGQHADGGGPVDVLIFGAGPIGLLFVAALARDGHRVYLADPNPGRLAMGTELGAAHTLEIERGGGQAERIKAETPDGQGVTVAIDSSGVPEVWSDAIQCVRPGGLVNLFGGCAPGTSIELDTHLVHYSELTIKGVYHHRPDTIRRALAMLADPGFKADKLLSAERPIDQVEDALRSMMSKDAFKVVIKGR
ncbi:MAG: alcohol dehydrogenase catalytic domain-containing protein [Rhodospirillales bacterium]|nr:alcohol dehydrogenase catalytic domain-containing protein [Alphaproteobacteria bacterium]MBL6947625.1 alcohol dehydrogenase catalytic domain-containing protein [Rhodospirillales bacterium]